MMLKFNDVLNMVKGKEELKVLTEGNTYFTVENEEGYRAYCEVGVYGNDLDNTDYYQGYKFSTVHRPNRKTGSGWQLMKDVAVNNEEDVFRCLDNTLQRSKERIQSGREGKDTRQPKNGFLY
jgi:hypothetical protein